MLQLLRVIDGELVVLLVAAFLQVVGHVVEVQRIVCRGACFVAEFLLQVNL